MSRSRSWRRLATAAAAALFTGAAFTYYGATAAVSTLGAWNVGAIALLAMAWTRIWSSNAKETEKRAAAEDPGRTALFLLSMVSSSVGLFVSAVLLRKPALAGGLSLGVWKALCLFAVFFAWVVSHTAWTLRYAHLHFRDDGKPGEGLKFPGGAKDGLAEIDFAYFAFTIGMCFQVSDVSVTTRSIRRDVLLHSCQSFAFNTAILALALNIASGGAGN